MKKAILVLILFFSFISFAQNKAKELIIEGVDAMLNKEHEVSLELLTKAKQLALEENLNEELFLAVNNIGANYYSLLDYGEALKNYLEAYTIAIRELDSSFEMTVLNNIAILYSKEKNYTKAEEYFLKAYALAKKSDDKFKLGIYAINLGQVLNNKNSLIKAEEFLIEAINILHDEPNILIDAKVSLSKNQYLQDKVENSKKIAFELLPQLSKPEQIEQRLSVLLTLSNLFEKENNLSQAIVYAKKALVEGNNIENNIEVFNQLSKLYIKSDSLNEALNIKDSLLIANENLNQIKNGRLFETNRVKFEIQNYQKELQDKEEVISAQNKVFNTLLISSIIILLLISWALRNSYISNKQRKILHKRSEEILNLELEKEKTDKLLLEKQLIEKETKLLLEQEQLKNEIEAKNRKLSAKALYLTDRNNLVSSIIQDLEYLQDVKSQPVLNNHIRKLKNLLKSDDEWNKFIKHFEEVNQGFLSNLKNKHSNLTSNDLRFISYLYMNLSLKEISSIFSITPEACRKRKERISKKLELKESKEIYNYLSRI